MVYPAGFKDQRQESRVNSEFPIQISIGSQLTLKGLLQDLSLKSAFIKIRDSIFLNISDEVTFVIQGSSKSADDLIQGMARVSRIVAGEGFAIYFTKIDEDSLARLKILVNKK